MKKNAFAAACLAASLALLSCHDVIFYEIRQEVKLNKGQISGDIGSIVECNKTLFVQNGNVYSKPASASAYGHWSPVSRDGMGSGKVIKLAADTNHVYALVARIAADKDEGVNYVAGHSLYVRCVPKNSEPCNCGESCGADRTTSWKKVNDLSFLPEGNHLYSLNETAYIKAADGIKKLNGCSTEQLAAEESKEYKIQAGNYSASGRIIQHNGSGGKDVGSKILSLAFKSENTSTATTLSESNEKGTLFVGTESGLRCYNANGGTLTETTLANSASALSSYYEVHCVFVSTVGDVYATAIFSGTSSSTGASSDNEGLWAYYPTRGNWNRE